MPPPFCRPRRSRTHGHGETEQRPDTEFVRKEKTGGQADPHRDASGPGRDTWLRYRHIRPAQKADVRLLRPRPSSTRAPVNEGRD